MKQLEKTGLGGYILQTH